MANIQALARFLILTGVIIVIIGLLLLLFGRLGFSRLPGDIVIERRNLVVYFPIVSMLVISLVLTLLLNLIFRCKK